MVYKFFSGILVESYGTWLLFQRLDDSSQDSDIPKNVPFAFAINNRNITACSVHISSKPPTHPSESYPAYIVGVRRGNPD